MKIKFLGSGSAFTIPERDNNYQSNILITKSEEQDIVYGSENNTLVTGETETVTKNLLIDAGEQISSALYYHGYEATDIDAIFITHNHSDHNSGLNYLGFKTYFIPPFGSNMPVLFGNPSVLDTLWENVLKGTMQSLRGERANLSTFFNVMPVKPRNSFNFMSTTFTPTQVSHVVDDYEEVPAYGLSWEEDNVKFFFSGDTMFDFWKLYPHWQKADVIFQDCEMIEYDGSVHAQFRQLKEIPEQIKSKMWLYHYMLYGKTYEEMEMMVKENGFAGLVKRGQEFDTLTLKEELGK